MTDTLRNKFDSIIFDLDGTLWDSTANVAIAWQAAKEEVNYIQKDITQQDVQGITGLTYTHIFEKLFPYLDNEKREAFKARASKNELRMLNECGGELYEGIEEVLSYLSKKYQLFIVSNCQSGYIETFFRHSGLEHYFQGHQCYGTKGKPKYENIQDIVADHQLAAPVYIGDTQADYEATVKAGVPFVFAAYGFGKVAQGQIASISSLSDLKRIL